MGKRGAQEGQMQVDFPKQKYNLIVVDPPWPVKKIKIKARPNQVKMDYATMSVAEIESLPVMDIAETPCVLFLWTTQKHLFDAMSVLTGWGFNHLATMVWEKTYGISSGMPLFGFRWNAEFILIGTHGKIDAFPKRSLIPMVFSAENIGHSVKPDIFYEMVSVLGDKRIDLFARKERDGWDVWGDEVCK